MQDIALNDPKIEKRPGCVAEALSIVGNKWTALIVLELSSGSMRFTALESALKISPRTLSQRLCDLEDKKLITKHCFAEVPPRVQYELTDKGRDLLPILRSMAEWGDKYSK